MSDRIQGLHHVTAVAGDAQDNVDFYTGVLGLRFLKRTVNFDDPSTYHLYYGNQRGDPGTTLTFFPFGGSPGKRGRGQATATAFAVPEGSLDFWRDRLDGAGVDVDTPTDRFGERVLSFSDHEGQSLELIAGTTDVEPWADGPVPGEHAIRGFHGVTLHSLEPEATGQVLDVMGFDREAEEDGRLRYRAPGDHATVVDVLTREGERGRQGPGTVHHVAFRTPDDETQKAWQAELRDAGLNVTDVRDRHYFRSIYFREPGGVLFEIATEGPGFTRDEDVADLGSELRLPPWLEDRREEIEAALPPLDAGAHSEVH